MASRAKKESLPDTGEHKYNYITKTWTDSSGKRHYVRGKTEKEAAEKLGALKERINRGEDGLSGKMKVQRWADEWLSVYVKPKVRKPGESKRRGSMTEKSYDMYEQKLKYILPSIKNMRMMDVRDAHLQKILNAQADMSDSHVKKLRVVMHAMFAQAVRSRVILYNPADDLTLPAAEKGARRSLTDYERQVILDVAETQRCGLWIRFLLATGIRPAESAPLLVSDLYLDNDPPCVKIYKAIESGTNDVVGSPKTEAGNRQIPLPDDLVQTLRAYVKGMEPDAFLFTRSDSKDMLTEAAISANWRGFIRQVDLRMGAETTKSGHIYDPADLLPDGKPKYPDPEDPSKPRNGHKVADDLCLYCLRHTYCTDLQKAGVPLNVAKYLMGHSNITTTANIYTHTGDEEIRQASILLSEKQTQQTAKAARSVKAAQA